MRWQLLYFDTFTDLRADPAPPQALAYALSKTVLGDVGKGFFIYDSVNVATDDNLNVIRPTGLSTGAWVRTTAVSFDPMWWFNASGLITPPTKVFTATISSLSTSNGYSIDISSAGFTSILPGSISIVATRNTSTVTSVPNVAIKTISTTAIVVNITEANTATVSILGINVLSGMPNVFASTSGLSLEIAVRGN